MCGPPDFGALNTCLIRLAELSAAGVGGYSVYRAAALCREIYGRRKEQRERGLRSNRGRLTAEDARGPLNA